MNFKAKGFQLGSFFKKFTFFLIKWLKISLKWPKKSGFDLKK